jgi:hypothetical protein
MFRTEYEFVLPKGFVDGEGTLHREGVMRLATAGDEIVPLKDPRVDKNPAYLGIILLSRVISRLGSLRSVTTHTIESLYASDYEFLQAFYNRINYGAGDAPEEGAAADPGEPSRVGTAAVTSPANGGLARTHPAASWGTPSR